ncbi:hypothetical protein MKZ38_009159 [Zalerion maritima]|uniref:Uncharacterized protein n=1 Tax=Zalerion maritima TaxID=339359 RepID=A0AAD5WME2_9PEZI|nr:hypothetical protein MKZ38_009159 [Zalerion maritima]
MQHAKFRCRDSVDDGCFLDVEERPTSSSRSNFTIPSLWIRGVDTAFQPGLVRWEGCWIDHDVHEHRAGARRSSFLQALTKQTRVNDPTVAREDTELQVGVELAKSGPRLARKRGPFQVWQYTKLLSNYLVPWCLLLDST